MFLIHGNSSCKEIFTHQMARPFIDRYRMIAVDLPGHGGSDPYSEPNFDPENVYTMPGYARVMVEVLGALEVSDAAILGWSLGGHIGLEMVPLFPGLKGLMITGTPPLSHDWDEMPRAFLPTDDMAFTSQEVLTDAQMDTYAAVGCGGNPAPFMVDAIKRTDGRARAIMAAHTMGGKASDQKAIAETMGAPLAVVNGNDEPFVNHEYIDELKTATFWRGRAHRLEASGHAPFWEKPAEFNTLFGQFLADVLQA